MAQLRKRDKERLVVLGILPDCEYKTDLEGLLNLMPSFVDKENVRYHFMIVKDKVLYYNYLRASGLISVPVEECGYVYALYHTIMFLHSNGLMPIIGTK